MIDDNSKSTSLVTNFFLGPRTPLMVTELKEHQKKLYIWKNVIGLIGGVGIFTMGLNPIDDLQSLLNDDDGLGVASLCIKYAFMILGNLFTNTLIIHRLGTKRALVWGTLLYSLYIIANFYPIWTTMIPLTIFAGLGGALMWTTQSHSLATLAVDLASFRGINSENLKTFIFGLRGMAIRGCAVFGGLASSLILSTGHSTSGQCEPNYCDFHFIDALRVAKPLKFNWTTEVPKMLEIRNDNYSMTLPVYMMCAFCTACALLGVLLMIILVDPLPQKQMGESDVSSCWWSLLFATVKLWKRKEQLLLIPVTIVCGFQEALWRADFNRTHITCSLRIDQIGFLLACYNTASLIGSFLCGTWLGGQRARTIAFPVMASIDIMALTVMFLWKPKNHATGVAYVITAVTGITYGAMTSLLPAFYGIVFPDDLEAAYSNLFFWCFLGSTFMYAFSYSLCLRIKLFIVTATIVVGLIGYLTTELVIRQIPEATPEVTETTIVTINHISSG